MEYKENVRRDAPHILVIFGMYEKYGRKAFCMDKQQKNRIVLTVLLAAAAVRVLFGGAFTQFLRLFTGEDMAAFLMFMSTGRLVTQVDAVQAETTQPTEPVQIATEPSLPLPAFTPEDALLADIHNETAYHPDAGQLLQTPLNWDLYTREPAVLILHTHATESYTPSEGYTYTPSSHSRTTDNRCNMIRVGDRLAQLLRQEGIGVIHATTLHDVPSYTGSYNAARKTIQQYLQEYPSIVLVLDLHRDAVELSDGTELATHVSIDGEETSRLMMVVGTDDGGLHHPQWKQNLALALKLHAQLEKNNPGICRFLSFRQERFNQDLSPGAMLIEVGAAGDTLPQALRATEYLAQAIIQLARGTGADSAN